MRIQTSLIGSAALFVLTGPAFSNAFSSGLVLAQTVNKPSIQITLRTHKVYYRGGGQRDDETWSWSPRIVYRVVGPIPAGSQLSVEYTLPSGKAWIKHDCPTQQTKDGYWWETQCGINTADVPDRLTFVTWFKGTPNTLNYAKYAAYLYYQGKLVADSTGEGKYGNTGCEVTNTAYEESPSGYCRRKFVVNAMVWDKQPQFHPQDFPMYTNAGEYEIKVLQNGKLVRVAKFTMGTNYKLVDSGIGKQNNLGTGRIVVPVQIIGDQDGQWDRNAYKTDAFFGTILSGFVVP